MERLLKCHSLLSIKILIIIDIRLLSNFTVFLIIIIQYNQHCQGNHSIIHIYQERKDLILLLKIATNYLVRKWKNCWNILWWENFLKRTIPTIQAILFHFAWLQFCYISFCLEKKRKPFREEDIRKHQSGKECFVGRRSANYIQSRWQKLR